MQCNLKEDRSPKRFVKLRPHNESCFTFEFKIEIDFTRSKTPCLNKFQMKLQHSGRELFHKISPQSVFVIKRVRTTCEIFKNSAANHRLSRAIGANPKSVR